MLLAEWFLCDWIEAEQIWLECMRPCVCVRLTKTKKEATVGREHCCSFVFLAVLMSLGHEEQEKEFFVLSEELQWGGKCGYLQFLLIKCWLSSSVRPHFLSRSTFHVTFSQSDLLAHDLFPTLFLFFALSPAVWTVCDCVRLLVSLSSFVRLGLQWG